MLRAHGLTTDEFDARAAAKDAVRGALEWRIIPGFEMYEVSENGSIRNSKTGVTLKPKATKEGHLIVGLYDGRGAQKGMLVHRAVAFAFLEDPPTPDAIVCHSDDVKTNNHRSNLYWGTHQRNAEDRKRNSAKRGPKPQAWRHKQLQAFVKQRLIEAGR